MTQERSRKLERQLKRHLGANAEELMQAAADKLEKGDDLSSMPEIVDILRKFSKFVSVIDQSYAEHEDRVKMATRNIEISSKELTSTLSDLENLNISINAMLDSLGQGLLFFDKKGICSSIYSKACLELLEIDPSNKPLNQVLRTKSEDVGTLKSWLEILFDGNTALDFDDIKALLPQELINDSGSTIALDYKPMYLGNEKLIGILLIATDITYQKKAEESLRETKINAEKIQKIAQNRNAYNTFLSNIDNFVQDTLDILYTKNDDNPPDEPMMQAIKRDLHTYKGLSLAFYLRDLANGIHDIETHIHNVKVKDSLPILKEDFSTLDNLVYREKDFAKELFGPNFLRKGNIKTLNEEQIEGLMRTIESVIVDQVDMIKVRKYITEEILSIPIFEAFEAFQREVNRVAEQQGKPIPGFKISGDNLPIIPEYYSFFFDAILHLARNIMVHGIATPEDRQEQDKPEQGQVTVSVEAFENTEKQDFIRIVVTDDGAGINIEKLREKLKNEKGYNISEQSDEDIIYHIFDPGLSLRDSFDIVSGRGIGMSALKDAVDRMNGNIILKTETKGSKAGTIFTFELPYNRQA